jgi:hypothetical protein
MRCDNELSGHCRHCSTRTRTYAKISRRAFLVSDHEAHRAIRNTWDFLPGDAAPDSKDEVDDDYKDEGQEDEEMEDAAPLATMKM